MRKYLQHFKTITKHRWIVRKLCFRCGLIRQGLLHDVSKYSLTEFISSAKHFQGTRSPIEAEKEHLGYSLAWQHHKGCNPHHWEYWIDNIGTRKNDPIKIPYNYVVEMICDWVAAGIVYSGAQCDFTQPYSEPLAYFRKMAPYRIFHEDTYELLEWFLKVIDVLGVNSFCKLARKKKARQILSYIK